MPIHIESTAVERMRATLLTFLVAELALIDAEYGDGILTDKPADTDIIKGTRKFDPLSANVLIEVYGGGSVRGATDTFAQDRLDADNEVHVRVNSADRDSGKPETLHEKNMRAAAAVVRVLHVKKWELGETGGLGAEWTGTRRTSPDDDYQVCRRVASFKVVTQESL